MNLHDHVALVTGSNRGLGRRLVVELLSHEVGKVYAAARDPKAMPDEITADARVVPLALDVTDDASVRRAVQAAPDVSLLVNNAGVLTFGDVLTADLQGIERDWRTNYLGTLRVCRAFLPALERARPAGIVNVLTLIALAPVGPMAGYSASKAAAHSMTQALRAAVTARGVTVLGAYPGGIDTDMLAGVDAEKAPPELVAQRIVLALQADRTTVFPDDASAGAGKVYQNDPFALEGMLAGQTVR